MTSKSLPRDLLEQANFLASKEPKRPKQASLRRAVSAAYYALFHLLSADGSELLAPNVAEPVRHLVQRWFDHGTMKETCKRFLAPTLGKPLSDLVDTAASPDMRRVLLSFIQLQDARHRADYDMSWNASRIQTQAYIQQAQDACDAWLRIRKSSEANIFILSLFLWKQIERTR